MINQYILLPIVGNGVTFFWLWSDKFCEKSVDITVIFRPVPGMIGCLDRFLS